MNNMDDILYEWKDSEPVDESANWLRQILGELYFLNLEAKVESKIHKDSIESSNLILILNCIQL